MTLDGWQLGHYRLQHLLGTGGMGEVYLAEDTYIPRNVAIKVIKNDGMPYPGTPSMDDANRLFLREARAIAALQHPYILQLFDYGEVAVQGEMLSYMVMPYCQEGSLDTWLRRRGSYCVPTLYFIAHILEQAADALQYAHDKQIIHQDVKPSNFLIHRWKASGLPDLLLADFGVAKFLSASSRSSQSIRGTPTSMAPEQWEGHPVPATDQYALAIMIYQLLTGYAPFQGGPGQIMYQHLTVEPIPPGEQRPGIPPEIDAVLLKALMKQPQQRFGTVLAFAQAFRQALPATSDLQNITNNVPMHDLRVTLALSTEEALSGTTRILTLPDGHSVNCSIPAGVQTGQTLRLLTRAGNSVYTLVVSVVVKQPGYEVPFPLIEDEQTVLKVPTPAPDRKTVDSTPPPVLSAIPPTILGSAPPISSKERRVNANQRMGYQYRGGINGKGLLLVPLILIIIAASAGITFILTRSSPRYISTGSTATTVQTTSQQAAATTTQLSRGGTATKGTASPIVTATAQAASNNPYPPFTGTLALNDPLTNNSKGYSWEEGTRDQGTCTFTEGAYQADIPLTGYFHSCLSTSTSFNNFVFEVQMTLVSSSTGGIVFRADRATTHLYYFTVDRNGRYLLKAYYDKAGDAMVIASGSGLNFSQTELIGVVAQGNTISLYVNRQLAQTVYDSRFAQGQIGVVTYEGATLFSNAKAWTL